MGLVKRKECGDEITASRMATWRAVLFVLLAPRWAIMKVWFGIAIVATLTGCADQAAVLALDNQIKATATAIEVAKIERAPYGEGSPLHAMITLRIAVHEQTLAMLNQKLGAVRWYPWFRYTVSGSVYTPPADAKERLAELEQKLQVERTRARTSKPLYGGLIGSIEQLTQEFRRLNVAQLEYQEAALRFGFPPLIAEVRPADVRTP